MQVKYFLIFLLLMFFSWSVQAETLDKKINDVMQSYYSKYKDKEYFSGFALSIYTPHAPIKNYYIGTVSHEKNSKKVDANTLFEIGSITKSFTSAIVLQLEGEKKLKLTDTLGQFLPQYTKWSGLSLVSLLNMTSGLPNYSNTEKMVSETDKDGQRQWTKAELIDIAYPSSGSLPLLHPAYDYTNTGYILSDMIIEKLTKHTFRDELETRLFKPAKLENTFYPIPTKSQAIVDRLASGYSNMRYGNIPFYHRDAKTMNLSWAGAAGGIVSNATDITEWVKALFIDKTILNEKQKKQLMELVSTKSGKPISQLTQDDQDGYGLGVAEYYNHGIEPAWWYEGATIGYRAMYVYFPQDGTIISVVVNSSVDPGDDHLMLLLTNVSNALVGK